MIANADVKVPPLSRPGQGGDRPGFEEQALPYLRELYPAAIRLTRSRCEAEDLVQETFTRAYAKFSQYQQGTNLRAWLYRIMFSTFCSTRRKQASRPSETLTADAARAGQQGRVPADGQVSRDTGAGEPGRLPGDARPRRAP